MKFNIIGDTHGRDAWKDLLIEDGINIFVGDYFSPYERIPFKTQKSNFLEIMDYADKHKDTTITLVGNHDEDHWHIRERYSRHDSMNCNAICELFNEFAYRLDMAYSLKNTGVVTHAGVSVVWYERYKNGRLYDIRHLHEPDAPDIHAAFELYSKHIEEYQGYMAKMFSKKQKPNNYTIYEWKCSLYRYEEGVGFSKIEYTPDEVSAFINRLWKEDRKYNAFNFRDNSSSLDTYGDSIQHSPVWIRPDSLTSANIFTGQKYWQFIGHTQFKHPVTLRDDYNNIGFTDCLGYNAESMLYDSETGNTEINKIKTN